MTKLGTRVPTPLDVAMALELWLLSRGPYAAAKTPSLDEMCTLHNQACTVSI